MENMDYNEKAGIVDNIVDLFVAPGKLSQRIEQKAQIVLPAILCAILLLITTFITKDLTLQMQLDAIRKQGIEMTPEMVANQSRFAMIGYIVAPFIFLLASAFISLLYMGISRIFGGTGKYSSIFSAVLYSSVISSVGGIINAIGAVFTENIYFNLSPSLLFDVASTSPWIRNALIYLNPFAIWSTIFLIIAFRIINRYSLKQSIINVLIFYILAYLFSSGAATFFPNPGM